MELPALTDRDLTARPVRATDVDPLTQAVLDAERDHWSRDYWSALPGDGLAARVAYLLDPVRAEQRHPVFALDAGVGAVGVVDLDPRRVSSAAWELGWWVSPTARGRGLATRGAALVTHWARPQVDRVEARVLVANWRSRHVALALGLRLEATLRRRAVDPDGARTDVDVFGLLADEEPVAPQPELSAGSLHLRPLLPADVEPVHTGCQDPAVQAWTTIPVPYDRHHAEDFVHRTAPLTWARGDGGVWAVVDSVDARLLAVVGLDLRPGGVAEVGFWALPGERGRGVVPAAVDVVCRYAFAELGVGRVQWEAFVGNEPSRRVAAKAGFTEEGLARSRFPRKDGSGRHDAWVAARVR